MSSVKDFETYARDCVNLAGQPDVPPELRDQLLQMAREWMKASMEAEDESEHPTSEGGVNSARSDSRPAARGIFHLPLPRSEPCGMAKKQ
jgi:hypothetical protein